MGVLSWGVNVKTRGDISARCRARRLALVVRLGGGSGEEAESRSGPLLSPHSRPVKSNAACPIRSAITTTENILTTIASPLTKRSICGTRSPPFNPSIGRPKEGRIHLKTFRRCPLSPLHDWSVCSAVQTRLAQFLPLLWCLSAAIIMSSDTVWPNERKSRPSSSVGDLSAVSPRQTTSPVARQWAARLLPGRAVGILC